MNIERAGELIQTDATNFDIMTGGYAGPTVTLYAVYNNPYVDHSGVTGANNTLVLKGVTNIQLLNWYNITFKYMNNHWYEIGRNF
jgi:hypothetical protein